MSLFFLGLCEMYANLCNTYAKHRFSIFWLLLRPKEHVFSLLNFSTCVQTLSSCPVSEFIDPSLGEKVNSGIGLSYRPARIHGLAGRYDNPMPELTLSPQLESMNLVTRTVNRVKGEELETRPRRCF
jgi:hypothetical protein